MGGVILPLFPTLILLFSQRIKIQVIAELTLAMEKWVSMGRAGHGRPMVVLDPAWKVQGGKKSRAGGSGTG